MACYEARSFTPDALYQWLREPPFDRLMLPVGVSTTDLQGRWVAWLFGALYALDAHVSDDEAQSLATRLRDHPELGASAREAWRKGRPAREVLARAVAEWLHTRLQQDDIAALFAQVLGSLEMPAKGPMETFAAWRGALMAVDRLSAGITYSGARTHQPPSANDDWLRWSHRFTHSGKASRSFKLAFLLMSLTARTEPLWWMRALNTRLQARGRPPEFAKEVFDALLFRVSLVDDEDERKDLRRLPFAKLLAAWARLQPKGEARSAHAWLRAAEGELRAASELAWRSAFSPAVRFEQRGDALARVGFHGKAERRSDLKWVSALILEDDAPRAQLADDPLQRTSAALAYALNQDSENFAGRVMPSLRMWASFKAALDGTDLLCDTDSGCLIHCEGAAQCPRRADRSLYLAPWRVRDSHGRWSATRLFTVLSGALIDGDAEAMLTTSRFQHTDELSAERVEALLEVLRRWVRTQQEQHGARLEAMRTRERGLRFHAVVEVGSAPWEGW